MDKREIAVDTDMMHSSAREMQNILDQMKSGIESLFAKMDEMSGMWDAPSHEAFLIQFRQDRQRMQEFENAAEKLTECMQYAEKEYQSCENAVSSIIHTIQI